MKRTRKLIYYENYVFVCVKVQRQLPKYPFFASTFLKVNCAQKIKLLIYNDNFINLTYYII